MFAAVEKSDVVALELERRVGDPAAPFARVFLAAKLLDFREKYWLEASIDSLF